MNIFLYIGILSHESTIQTNAISILFPVAGPVGALAGGAMGTALAASISRHVVSLSDLLVDTPADRKGEVYRLFSEAMQEAFQDGFTQNSELRLLMGGGSIISVMRYALDKDLIETEKLEKLDVILKRIK